MYECFMSQEINNVIAGFMRAQRQNLRCMSVCSKSKLLYSISLTMTTIRNRRFADWYCVFISSSKFCSLFREKRRSMFLARILQSKIRFLSLSHLSRFSYTIEIDLIEYEEILLCIDQSIIILSAACYINLLVLVQCSLCVWC